MRKFENGFLALALLAGISGALAPQIHAAAKPVNATYHWEKLNRDGTRNPSLDEDATIAQATIDYSCSGASTPCANGTKVPGSGTGNATAQLLFN